MISSWILLSYKYNRNQCIVRGCRDWNYKVINIVKKLIINYFMSGHPPFSSCRNASIYIPITKYWSKFKTISMFYQIENKSLLPLHYGTVQYCLFGPPYLVSVGRYWAIIMVVYFASSVVAGFEHLHMVCFAKFRVHYSSLSLLKEYLKNYLFP